MKYNVALTVTDESVISGAPVMVRTAGFAPSISVQVMVARVRSKTSVDGSVAIAKVAKVVKATPHRVSFYVIVAVELRHEKTGPLGTLSQLWVAEFQV